MEVLLTETRDGGSDATERWELTFGLTVEQFFGMAYQGCDRDGYMMLVNGYPVDWDSLLRHGDRVLLRPFDRPRSEGGSFTP